MSETRLPARDATGSAAHSELFQLLAARLQEGLPGHLGIRLVEMVRGRLILQMPIQPFHTAANGYLHAGAIITLADTACGFGCLANLPEDANNFTTVELKSNFLRTALEGVILAEAVQRHAGRRTQIWDAEVRDAQNRILALFRCTQMLLYPSEEGKART